ncbi:MAG: hypothetical protein WDA25_06800 [Paracoccaceae bacterium]
MTNKMKFMAGTVVSLFLATGAVAQDGMGITPGSAMGQTWSDGAANAFFTDDGSMTLRPTGEIEANWANLSEPERAQIRADCTAMSAEQSLETDMGDAAGAEEGAENPEVADSDSLTTPLEQITSGNVSLTVWTQLCDTVSGL